MIKPEDRRIQVISTGYTMPEGKRKPKEEGFTWELTKEITDQLNILGSKFKPDAEKTDKIMLRIVGRKLLDIENNLDTSKCT